MNTELLKQTEMEAFERWPAGLNPQCAIARYGFNGAIQYAITHLQAQKGERVWREVDAKTRKPVPDPECHGFSITVPLVFNTGQIISGYYEYVNDFWINDNADKQQPTHWLEPAPPLAPENEAVLFAEWMEEHFYKTSPKYYVPRVSSLDNFDSTPRTTQQLYTIYKQQK